MWKHEESIEIAAVPDQVWHLFSDVAGWKQWNSGIEKIELYGAFANGTTLSMQPTGENAFTSTLVDVRRNECFTDETVIDGTHVLVHHRIEPLAPGRVKVVYSAEITGPGAADFGPMVTADFADVLQSLKRVVEAAAKV